MACPFGHAYTVPPTLPTRSTIATALSIAFAGAGQHQDAGAKIVHAAPDRPRTSLPSRSARTAGAAPTGACSELRRASSVAPSRVAQVRCLDELNHLPIRDEITLGIRRVREEAAGYRQLVPIGSFCLFGDPRAVDPPLGNQTDRGLDLRAG